MLSSTLHVLDVSGKHYHKEVLVHPVPVHDRFQEWRQDGVFKRMWIDGLKIYDKKVGINWKWQSMDGAITKAPLGGKKYRTKSHRQK